MVCASSSSGTVKQMAVGALFRSRRAIIVGDPKQVEPVVTDDLRLLREAFTEPVYAPYQSKSLSVQSCADLLNPLGAFLNGEEDEPESLAYSRSNHTLTRCRINS